MTVTAHLLTWEGLFTFPPSLSSSSSSISISLADAALVAVLSFSLVNGGVGIDWVSFFFDTVGAGEEEAAEKDETAPLAWLLDAEEAVAVDCKGLVICPVLPLEA